MDSGEEVEDVDHLMLRCVAQGAPRGAGSRGRRLMIGGVVRAPCRWGGGVGFDRVERFCVNSRNIFSKITCSIRSDSMWYPV